MKHLNLILALLCLLTWASLYLVYYKEQIIPWAVNRFTRDKMPKDIEIKDGYFSDGIAVPFRENLYPSQKPAQPTEGKKAKEDTPSSTPQP